MWPFKRKESIRDLLEAISEDLESNVNKLESQLKNAIKEFKEYAQRAEEEKKAMGAELKAKTTFIEGLFANMLDKTHIQNQPQNQKKEEDSNLVDISKLSDTMKGMIKTKLAEANKQGNGQAKKIP